MDHATTGHLAPPGRRLTPAMLLLAVLLTAGCVWKGQDGREPTTAPAAEAWVIRPVNMRVYPSTRFRTEGTTAILDSRVELLDEMGDSVKGVGRWRFELVGLTRTGDPESTRPLYAWDVAMLTLAQNRAYYDPVTRTYRFQLKLDDLSAAQRPVRLVVSFTPPDQARMQTSLGMGMEE